MHSRSGWMLSCCRWARSGSIGLVCWSCGTCMHVRCGASCEAGRWQPTAAEHFCCPGPSGVACFIPLLLTRSSRPPGVTSRRHPAPQLCLALLRVLPCRAAAAAAARLAAPAWPARRSSKWLQWSCGHCSDACACSHAHATHSGSMLPCRLQLLCSYSAVPLLLPY